jgi:hypothetical protein
MTAVTAAAASSNANTAGPPTLTHQVQPTYTRGNITKCPQGTTTFVNTSESRSTGFSEEGTTFQTMVSSDGNFVSFTTNSLSFTVYVKGGPAYDTFDYTGAATHPSFPSDTGLHAPFNPGDRLPDIGHYLACGQPAGTKASPTLVTTAGAGGTVGDVVLNDTGMLSGGASPTGAITFNLFDASHSDCSGTPAFTQTLNVSGDGSLTTTNSRPANLAGTWSWTAAYSGDDNNNPASSACGQETASVAKAAPSLTTTPTVGGPAGTVVLNDAGLVAGGFQPGGSITFNLFDPAHTDCSGTPVFTQTVTVAGNGSYTTTNSTPANVAGTWSWTATYSGDVNNESASSLCMQETVKVTSSVAQGSCAGAASLSTLVSGPNVISYIPQGFWSSTTRTGIDVVNVEGTSVTNTVVPTGSDVINSCASNSLTGQTVCTANNTHVYVLKGTALDPTVTPNPLTDGGSGTIGFSGGAATTTGVTMDAADNQALLGLSVQSLPGFQFLDLATDTFEPAFTSPSHAISESPLIDPARHLILSAAENNNFEAVNVATSTAPQFFEHPVSSLTGELDASAEDCSTGIALAPAEFSSPSQVEVADITPPQAVFTPGTPGSWTAPEQVQTLTGSNLNSGASGAAIAQGTHTGVISGEVGGDGLTALALPTTSGAGAVPAIGNWLSCAVGKDPSGNQFEMGLDPHTLAAYQSPSGAHAIALLVNQGATEMVRVDLTDMLDPAIVPATDNVCGNGGILPPSVESFIPLP